MDISGITTIALALCIGILGEVMKALVNAKAGDRGWRGVYYVTYRSHAVVVGLLAALALHGAIKIPEEFGESLAGFALWGASTGGLAMVGYTTTVGMIRARIKQLGER